MLKKSVIIFMCAVLLMTALSGCTEKAADAGDNGTVLFTDSCGREVSIPAALTRVAPSGAVATMFLAAIAPEYMVTVSKTPTEAELEYLPKVMAQLPETGQVYGSKATLNLETLLEADPQIIIDLGDYKDGMEEDLNALQEQTGIPVVFIESDVTHMAEAFRTLGSILDGKAERGGELGAFADETVKMAAENSAKITDDDRVSVMFTIGASGLDTNAKGSSQAQVIELVGAENAIVVDDVSPKGGGNTIDMEQLYNFDPDVIVFSKGSYYSQCRDDPSWALLDAVENGRIAEIPGVPYNWMSNPPSMNMLLGVWWLGNLIYPQYYDYDILEKTREIYSLFWGCELTDAEAGELLTNAAFYAQ